MAARLVVERSGRSRQQQRPGPRRAQRSELATGPATAAGSRPGGVLCPRGGRAQRARGDAAGREGRPINEKLLKIKKPYVAIRKALTNFKLIIYIYQTDVK